MRARLSLSTLPDLGLNSAAPSRANAIFCPAATFGAPQTTVAGSTVARVNRRQPQPVRVGMRRHVQHVPDDNLLRVPVRADHLHVANLDARHSQLVGNLSGRVLNGDIVLEPR